MAEISPQAFILHQSQRNTRTIPMPAPSSRLVSHANWMEVSWVMMSRAIARIKRLAPRATHTSVRPVGFRFSQASQMNRL